MSPDAYELADRRIALDVKEAARVFAYELAQRYSEISVEAGEGFSSAMVHQAFSMARDELERRAMRAWTFVQRILDADDSAPTDDTHRQITELIRRAVIDDSEDIATQFMKYRARFHGDWQTLDESRQRAFELAITEVDIDLLRRRQKRLPLGDVLRAPRYAAALSHWSAARAGAESELPDMSAAAREAVLAIESLAKRVLPINCATLGDCIKELRSRKLIDPGADKLLEGLWIFANATPSVRHGGSHAVVLGEQDWTVLRPMFEGALVMLLAVDAEAP